MGPSLTGRNGDANALHRVVAETAVVPRCLEWLDVSRAVGRTATELVLTGRGIPLEGEAAPRVRPERRLELCVGPRRTAVVAHFDPLDRCLARPRPALERDMAGGDVPLAGEEVRDPRRDEQRARQHPF